MRPTKPLRVQLFVTPECETMVVTHWPDGVRTCDWVRGFWKVVRMMWTLQRSGVPVEVMD